MKIMKSLLVPAACLSVSATALGAGLGQQAEVVDEEVIVTGEATSDLSARSAADAIKELERVPGGIGLVLSEDYLVEFTQSIGDALEFTPGVFADTSAQRENRISIRGSGANSTFERRGITVLRDGVPISRASGITEFQEIDPLSIDYIEVFKGSNGLRYGAASLGGAINIVTPTGANSDPGSSIRVEAGSFDTGRVSVNTKGQSGNVDYYAGVTKLNSKGFRDHADVDSIYSFGNVGIQLSDTVSTRFYLTALQDDFELAGTLSLEEALNNPESVNSENALRDFDRNLDVYRLSNRTVFDLDYATIETGVWYAKRDLDHAITRFVGIIDQSEDEYGVSAELKTKGAVFGKGVDWVVGASFAESDNDARVFEYVGGPFGPPTSAVGDLVSDDDQDARNTIAYGQADIALTDSLNFIAGGQYVRSVRRNVNILGAEDDTGRIRYEEVSGRLGLLYSPTDDMQYYANISQGYEPPGITDLTSGGAQPFTELEAQESVTYEIGSRGTAGVASWDVSLYRSEIKNEFIDLAVPGFGGTSTVTDNAQGDTIHQGVELGLDLRLTDNVVWRNIYTFNDFEFDNDPIYGDNTIPGIPESVYIGEVRYTSDTDWYAGVNFRHVANGPYADFANTVQAPGYELIGLIAGMPINDNVSVFFSAENITDEEFISNVSTVADLSTASNSDVFTPGEGRAAYVGITADF